MKNNILFILSFLTIIGVIIYLTTIKSKLDNSYKEIDKKISLIKEDIDNIQTLQNTYIVKIDSLRKLRSNSIISNKYYMQYENIKNINSYDTVFNSVLLLLDSLKSPNFR